MCDLSVSWSRSPRWSVYSSPHAVRPPKTTQPTAAPQPAPADAAPVRIGSKNFTEAILVAEMYALALENAGIRVERKFNLGATPVAHTALVNGEIDLYPEYTSTGLLEVLKQAPISDAGRFWRRCAKDMKSNSR